jgi:2-keto-3-deoxy-galactonokinase
MTGEAFAALSQHTILGRMMALDAPHAPAAFARGLARAKQKGGLLHHLFGTRAPRCSTSWRRRRRLLPLRPADRARGRGGARGGVAPPVT